MEGRGFNPKQFEPDSHEEFFAPPREVMDRWMKIFTSKDPHSNETNYDQIQEYRKRRQSHALGHYAYEMMYDIYAGIEDEIMDGAIDAHLHIYPDYVPRSIDIIQLAINASKAKMRAIVCKDHFFPTVGQAWGAQWVVDEMVKKGELERAVKVLGTHILAWSHHPDQIRLVRKYPNLGAIFFYTFTGGVQAGPPLKIVDEKGKLTSEVKDCIRLAAENKIPIMTGHKTPDLVYPMVEYAVSVKAHILVTHAGGARVPGGMAGTLEQAKELARMGAYLEINGNKWLPNMMWPAVDPNSVMEYIEAVGPEHCLADTDFGQVLVCDPIDGLRLFIRGMFHWGLKKEAIVTMLKTNPAKYLYLDD
jgi:hypothetical protein